MAMSAKRFKQGWNLENGYAQLPQVFFSNCAPTPASKPKIVLLNEALAIDLGFEVEELRDSETGLQFLAGNKLPPNSMPIAQAYAGHQFGHFTMLGDGRAVLLGEQIVRDTKRMDIQLKGAGKTPYSRRGDGRAALGPMLREYIISEAMYALGVPTTRSLAVVTTGEMVLREKEYPGAVLVRVADSHLRVGTFEYIASKESPEDLKTLADYAIRRHYSEIGDSVDRYKLFFEAVVKRQAILVAKWQLVGFVHGVMNTDNMSICGETIDYGPCAFMDKYDRKTVFSSIDHTGRYAYGNQPYMTAWNLSRFAGTLLPLLDEDKHKALKFAQEIMETFAGIYKQYWLSGMRTKLGIFDAEQDDETIIGKLLSIMEERGMDYTNTFCGLTVENTSKLFEYGGSEFINWYAMWKNRIDSQGYSKDEVVELMRKSNPAIIPRNHRVEEALAAAVDMGDYSKVKRLNAALAEPYAYSPLQDEYVEPASSGHPYRTFCGT